MKIIIEGAGDVGSHLAKMLRAEGNSVAVIDSDIDRLNAVNSTVDVITFAGDPSSISLLKDAGAAEADLLIAVNPFVPQDVNLVGAMLAKQMGTRKVVARIKDEEYLTREGLTYLHNIGIDHVFYPEKIASDEVVEAIRHNSSTGMLELARGKMRLAVFRLNDESPVLDLKLSEVIENIGADERGLFRVIAISRDSKCLIPRPETRFHYGDMVYIMAKSEILDTIYHKFGQSEAVTEKLMIMGGGEIGEMVARSADKIGVNVKIIEKDRTRCLELSERLPESVKIINGDGRNTDTLFDESIPDYDTFIAMTDQDESNVLACVAAKKLGVQRTMAKVENLEYIRMAEELGVDNVINKKLIVAGHVFRLTLSDKARFVKCMTGTDAEVLEYTAVAGSGITKAPLKNIKFPENAIVAGVTRGDNAFIAVGDTVIEDGDRVSIFALPEAIKSIEKLFR